MAETNLMNSHVFDYYNNNFDYDKDTGFLTRTKGQFAGKKQTAQSIGYIQTYIGGRGIKAHQLIWMMVYREVPEVIDHIDGNGLNNLLSNLRECTFRENTFNRFTTRAKRMSPKGVKKWDRLFYAEIYSHGKRIPLGGFETEREAAHAYNKAAIIHHGEFAKLNPL